MIFADENQPACHEHIETDRPCDDRADDPEDSSIGKRHVKARCNARHMTAQNRYGHRSRRKGGT